MNLTSSKLFSTQELKLWRNAIIVIFFVMGLSFATWASRIPAIRDELDWTTNTIGISFLIFSMVLGSIVGLSLAPLVHATIGSRTGMLASLIASSSGLILTGLASTVLSNSTLVGGGLVLVGLGHGTLDVLMNVDATDLDRERTKTIVPFMHACFSLGTFVGALIGAGCEVIGLNVTTHFTFSALLVITLALFVPRFVPLHAHQQPTSDEPKFSLLRRSRAFITIWKDLRLVLIGMVMLGTTLAEGVGQDWIALAVVDEHGHPNTIGIIVLGCFLGAMVVSRLIGGPLTDKFGRVKTLRVSAGIAVLGIGCFIASNSLWLVILGAICWGFGVSLGFPLGMSAAADNTDKPAARVAAVAFTGYFAFLAGPLLIGWLAASVGLLNAFSFLLVLLAISLWCAHGLEPRPNPQHALEVLHANTDSEEITL